MSLVTEMAQLPLLAAPQGGKFLLISVRARNLQDCVLHLTTALRDPDSGVVLTLDRRPITLEAGADGWLTPKRPQAQSNYSNLPACPLSLLTQAVNDHVYGLEVTAEDGQQRMAQMTTRIVPECTFGGADCTCVCDDGYRLGANCAMVDDGGSQADAPPPPAADAGAD
jgi:hypothetical protein